MKEFCQILVGRCRLSENKVKRSVKRQFLAKVLGKEVKEGSKVKVRWRKEQCITITVSVSVFYQPEFPTSKNFP